jgi:hypothetical protein
MSSAVPFYGIFTGNLVIFSIEVMILTQDPHIECTSRFFRIKSAYTTF